MSKNVVCKYGKRAGSLSPNFVIYHFTQAKVQREVSANTWHCINQLAISVARQLLDTDLEQIRASTQNNDIVSPRETVDTHDVPLDSHSTGTLTASAPSKIVIRNRER